MTEQEHQNILHTHRLEIIEGKLSSIEKRLKKLDLAECGRELFSFQKTCAALQALFPPDEADRQIEELRKAHLERWKEVSNDTI